MDGIHRLHVAAEGVRVRNGALGPEGNIVALVLLIFALPVLALIGFYAVAPQRASKMLVSLRTWMEKNNRTITVLLCLVFGAFFLVRGFLGA